MQQMLTVFTPTYNREKTLVRLYDSLVKQTDNRFVWLIVDDGSSDNTKQLVDGWIEQNKIQIRYEYQVNQGKSMAHNKGVELTQTELFTCVDSDDYLAETAVEEILGCWEKARPENTGILTFKTSDKGIVTSIKQKNVQSTLKNAYDNLGLVGDTMLVFRTSVISKYAFPKFEGEKFVPESYLYDLIDRDGTLMVLERPLYVCEYLDDGYTKNMAKLLKNNPQGYLAYINQRLKFDTKLKDKAADTIRYTAMAIAKGNKRIIRDAVYPFVAWLTYPLGWYFYCKRYRGV